MLNVKCEMSTIRSIDVVVVVVVDVIVDVFVGDVGVVIPKRYTL